MDIRIENLTLHNFKGVRSLTVPMEGLNVEIAGRNGAGKSTIFDAFIWLLFGKDHRGQDWTNFDIKPIDPATGEAIHHLDHYVEAQLLIDGSRKTLRREIREDWIKPRGQAEEVFKGHTQAFFIDGVPCSTKRDYDTAVAQWISEDIFKIVTNPHYLVDDQYTDWKARRKVLLSLAGDIDLTGIRARFADVLAEANGTPLEDFRKKVAADRKAVKRNLDEANANVKAWNKALPEPVDLADIEEQKRQIAEAMDAAIDKVKAEVSDVDAGVLDAQAAVNKTRAAIAEKAKEAQGYADAQQQLIRKAYDAAQALYAEQLEAYDKQKNSIATVARTNDQAAVKCSILVGDINQLEADIEKGVAALKALGELYNKEAAAAFEHPGTCPECGQPLPQAYLDKEETWRKDHRKERLDDIKNQGARRKEQITKMRETLATKKSEYEQQSAIAAESRQRMEQFTTGASLLTPPVSVSYDAVAAEVRKGKKYTDLQAKIDALEAECKQMQDDTPVNLAGLVTRRALLDAEIDRLNKEKAAQLEPLLAREAVNGERFRLEGMIAAENDRARTLADELARLERLEFSAAKLAKAEIDAQTEAVNALFKVARWKMFDYTIDGGAVEMCEALSPDGVPYRSMNDAMRVQIGMDVIRTVGARYGITAPIFIDNAESVLQDTFDTPAQVIRLVVADQDLTINK